VVVEEESGVSSFTELQEALKAGRSDRMAFYAFDLLYLGGYDLTKVPLVDRKTLLAGCLDDLPAGGAIRYSEHIERPRSRASSWMRCGPHTRRMAV